MASTSIQYVGGNTCNEIIDKFVTPESPTESLPSVGITVLHSTVEEPVATTAEDATEKMTPFHLQAEPQVGLSSLDLSNSVKPPVKLNISVKRKITEECKSVKVPKLDSINCSKIGSESSHGKTNLSPSCKILNVCDLEFPINFVRAWEFSSTLVKPTQNLLYNYMLETCNFYKNAYKCKKSGCVEYTEIFLNFFDDLLENNCMIDEIIFLEEISHMNFKTGYLALKDGSSHYLALSVHVNLYDTGNVTLNQSSDGYAVTRQRFSEFQFSLYKVLLSNRRNMLGSEFRENGTLLISEYKMVNYYLAARATLNVSYLSDEDYPKNFVNLNFTEEESELVFKHSMATANQVMLMLNKAITVVAPNQTLLPLPRGVIWRLQLEVYIHLHWFWMSLPRDTTHTIKLEDAAMLLCSSVQGLFVDESKSEEFKTMREEHRALALVHLVFAEIRFSFCLKESR